MIEDNPYYMPDKETIISTDALFQSFSSLSDDII